MSGLHGDQGLIYRINQLERANAQLRAELAGMLERAETAVIAFFDDRKYPLTRKPIQDGMRRIFHDLSLTPYQQMVLGNHSIGVIKDGKLIATDAEVYAPPVGEESEPVAWRFCVEGMWFVAEKKETCLRKLMEAEFPDGSVEIYPLYASPDAANRWVSVNDSLPSEGVPVLLLHRDGTQWTGYKGIERPGFEDTFRSYPYFIDTGEHEMWEWDDICFWRYLPVTDHISFAAKQETK